MSSAAVVFAPHQDDETLGCGGTMTLKAQAGTPISCVFMTDGGTSHRGLIDENDLRHIRRCEALEATAVLGLTPEQVRFLDFPDSQLARHIHAAEVRVAEILEALAPEEVFVPYRSDGTPDHEATYRIVVAAARRFKRPVRLLEYPVWFWNQWPWVPLPVAPSRDTMKAAKAAWNGRFGRRLLREFRSGAFIKNVLDRKREALVRYRSQMTVLRSGRQWPTLEDVSEGEFLRCFFDDFEVFRTDECESS
jgi:LmbE family N-acetylglucosaminyl deacetylase